LPLDSFPNVIGNWNGKELSIPSTTQEYMKANFADDYVSRRYINDTDKIWADVYIVYCSSRPGGMLGHQPSVCFPSNGWIHDGTEQTHFATGSGKEIGCLIHRFHMPASTYDQRVVLNFYLVNGRLATDQRAFSGLFGRRFNLARNPARYVAQIQISSTLENSARQAAQDMAELIFEYIPDENGQVKAAEQVLSACNLSQ
jgi:EpsI family protein